MTIIQILIFLLAAAPFMWILPGNWRPWGLMIGSLAAVAWLITGSDRVFSSLDFLLFAATPLLTILVWWIVQPEQALVRAGDRMALILVCSVLVLGWALTGLTDVLLSPVMLITGGTAIVVAAIGVSQWMRPKPQSANATTLSGLLVVAIVGLLVILKFPPLADYIGFALQWDAASLSAASPLVWLGFSYIAFRLIAILLDYQNNRLKADIPLRDMLTYVLFFPAFTAGPIDRADRFTTEASEMKPLDAPRFVEGAGRVAIGVFKKFVVADTLALVAMQPELIARSETVGGAWVLLYLYTFQIFFDFSGYSDVAIGLGRLYGITLPENFDRPYLQRNIQQFWQRWHITLSTWFRIYYFIPATRFFITRERRLPQPIIVFIVQLSTMVLIGLWHGITLNFLLWGLWHGAGLFSHKMLADNSRQWTKRVNARVWSRRLLYSASVFTTFHFVTLGWVFFALPEAGDSISMMMRLIGMG